MFNCECGADLIQDDCETILDVCQEAPVMKDYETLTNKPQINGVTLDGNKTSEDLGITQEIADAVSAEATLRENADTALGGRIDDEITNRGDADTALGGRIDGEITNRTNADNALGTRIDNEILARQGGDNNLQTQIDAITSKSDVVDVVADYVALQAYDTQHLGNNDVIKVLDDETRDNAQTYYRWNKTAGTWSYIGSEAPYYSKGQMDVFLQAKQDKLIAGTNIQIAQDGKTISATDTTYTAGNGLNLNGTEFSADTTVLATKSDLNDYYTKTETDTKLAPKLETEVVSALPATGEEGKLYLTPKAHTTQTATGNPVTVSVTEQAGKLESFQLDGDTLQNGTPTPEEPVPIQTVTGEQTVTVIGKNLFNKNAVTNGGYIDTNGEVVAWETFGYSEYIRVIGGQTYSYSGTANNVGYSAKAAWYDSNKNFISAFSFGQSGQVTAPATAKFLRTSVRIASPSGLDTYQLELGSTATAYEPYSSNDYEINLGKNLFDKNNATITHFYPHVSEIRQNESAVSIVLPVEDGTTYTVSTTNRSLIDRTPAVACTDHLVTSAPDSFLSRTSWDSGDSVSFTAPAGAKYMYLYVKWTTDATEIANILSTIQVEKGSQATTYAPYFTPIELCKLGTYQDYIWKDGDTWKVHKLIGKYTYDGTESNWAYTPNVGEGGTASGGFYRIKPTGADGANFPNAPDAISDHYRGGVRRPMALGTFTIGSSITFASPSTTIDNVAEWTQWLASNNTTVYYKYSAGSVTDTTITDTDLIAQLEAIRTASLENGTNTITNNATGSNLAGDMEIGYYGYNPTNRYDKFIWLDIDNNYEKIGS